MNKNLYNKNAQKSPNYQFDISLPIIFTKIATNTKELRSINEKESYFKMQHNVNKIKKSIKLDETFSIFILLR